MNKLSKQQNSVSIVSTLPNTTSKEISIYNAYLSDKKLKEFSSKEDLMLLNSLIVRWTTYVGIETPEASQINMLSNFIKEHFPSFNTYDLKECINLLTTQKLDTDAEHYGKLSPIYVSKVLKAYQEHKNTILFKIRETLQKVNDSKVVPILNETRISNFKELLTIAKKENSQGLTYVDTGDSIYGFVKFNKLISITTELKEDAISYGEKIYSTQIRKKAIETAIKNIEYKAVSEIKSKKDIIVLKYAREYVVNRFLLGLDLNDLLQKINIEMLNY